MSPPNKGKGKGIAWIREHANYQGDDCLPWPMHCDDKGYAILAVDGRIHKAHRYMCELVNGPPPTPEHEAAHNCGNGHLGCVNQKHLAWKTRAENQQDRISHGTAKPKGCARSNLSPAEIAEIRLLGGSMTNKAIAERFGTVPSNISKILSGARWKKMPGWLQNNLTQSDLADIRVSDETSIVLAERYGVSQNMIWRVRHGRPYSHIPETRQ